MWPPPSTTPRRRPPPPPSHPPPPPTQPHHHRYHHHHQHSPSRMGRWSHRKWNRSWRMGRQRHKMGATASASIQGKMVRKSRSYVLKWKSIGRNALAKRVYEKALKILINNIFCDHAGGHTIGSGHVRQGILTNGFAKAPNPNARLLSLPGLFCQQTKLCKSVKRFAKKFIHFCSINTKTSCCAGSSKSSAERYAVSYRSFDSHDSEEVTFK